MPTRAKQVNENGRAEGKKAKTVQRLNFRQRGYTARWDKAARHWRMNVQKVCQICIKTGVVSPAECVDHIIPHKGDQQLFWDESNWQSLCIRCHNQKSARGE